MNVAPTSTNPRPGAAGPADPPGAGGTAAGLGRSPRRAHGRAGSLVHSGVSVGGFYLTHVLGASVPLVAGVALFGWRAAATVGGVLAGAVIALLCWRTIGARGRQVQPAQALWMALLLGLMLPPHLASNAPTPSLAGPTGDPPWPVLFAGGILLVVLLWLVGGVGAGRLHPAVFAYLGLAALFWATLQPHWVLGRPHLGAGDLLRAPPPGFQAPSPDPWLDRAPDRTPDGGEHHAFWFRPAAESLSLYTRGQIPLDRGQRMPLHELLRDRMPPLEDLVIGGQPAPVGSASAVAVIVGGLFLLYRGLIDFRIPLLIVLSAYAAFLVLPAPTVLTDQGAHLQWLLPRRPDVLLGQAVTFANYELAAGPGLFAAFFLATAPSLRPLARRARAVYAVLVGVGTAAAQLYVSVALGPYLALAAVGLLGPSLDRLFRPRTLV